MMKINHSASTVTGLYLGIYSSISFKINLLERLIYLESYDTDCWWRELLVAKLVSEEELCQLYFLDTNKFEPTKWMLVSLV